MPVIDYFYFHFKFNDFYFYFLFFYFYFILFFLLFYFAWDFDSCAYGRWAATYRKDHGWDFLVERYGSLETKVEAIEFTKNKIRRLLEKSKFERELTRLECSINYEGGKKQKCGMLVRGVRLWWLNEAKNLELECSGS